MYVFIILFLLTYPSTSKGASVSHSIFNYENIFHTVCELLLKKLLENTLQQKKKIMNSKKTKIWNSKSSSNSAEQ